MDKLFHDDTLKILKFIKRNELITHYSLKTHHPSLNQLMEHINDAFNSGQIFENRLINVNGITGKTEVPLKKKHTNEYPLLMSEFPKVYKSSKGTSSNVPTTLMPSLRKGGTIMGGLYKNDRYHLQLTRGGKTTGVGAKSTEVGTEDTDECSIAYKRYMTNIFEKMKDAYDNGDVDIFTQLYDYIPLFEKDKYLNLISKKISDDENPNGSFYEIFIPLEIQNKFESVELVRQCWINPNFPHIQFCDYTTEDIANSREYQKMFKFYIGIVNMTTGVGTGTISKCEVKMMYLKDLPKKMLPNKVISSMTREGTTREGTAKGGTRKKLIKKFGGPCNGGKKMDEFIYFLGPREINSGYQTDLERQFPRDGIVKRIVLFRVEEVLKIIIHECLHAIEADKYLHEHNLDAMEFFNWFRDHINYTNTGFSCIDKSSTSPILFGETYAETWANIILELIINKVSKMEFQEIYDIERAWIMFQTAKLMNYYGFISFNEIFKVGITEGEKVLKQNTNVIAYYLCRAALYFDLDELFTRVFDKNEKGKVHIYDTELHKLMFPYFTEVFTSSEFGDEITNMMEKIRNEELTDYDDFISNTLRMTVFELKNFDII